MRQVFSDRAQTCCRFCPAYPGMLARLRACCSALIWSAPPCCAWSCRRFSWTLPPVLPWCLSWPPAVLLLSALKLYGTGRPCCILDRFASCVLSMPAGVICSTAGHFPRLLVMSSSCRRSWCASRLFFCVRCSPLSFSSVSSPPLLFCLHGGHSLPKQYSLSPCLPLPVRLGAPALFLCFGNHGAPARIRPAVSCGCLPSLPGSLSFVRRYRLPRSSHGIPRRSVRLGAAAVGTRWGI